MRGYAVGIDVGGTFTDFVVVRPDGTIRLAKHPTTPSDQSEGVLAGLAQIAGEEGESVASFLRKTLRIVHGTTTADNTMIEMNGAVTGLVTSAGHRDEIELRRGFKEDIWDPALPPPPPIAPRRRRIGVPERLDYEGNVLVPLDEEAVRAALRRLRKQGTESLAVVFLFSFINPRHEQRVREIAREECPEMAVWLSHEVLPAAPEFERTSTTLVNAYVGPKIDRYVRRLADRLHISGYRGELLLMQSNGGMMGPQYILQRPVTLLASGPTGGVMAACRLGREAGVMDFICADMGGTSYDVCLVRGAEAEIRSGWNWHHRYLIALPMVQVHSIGAGGGSLARVVSGSLQVGPQSAGADPGPICYGRGGRVPTVTDANLLLGYLNPEAFCAGTMRLQREGVAEAIEEQIARPLGLSVEEAAYGIYRLVNANMANAIRRISAQRGVDPREFALVMYGGNGPVHATAQARELGIRQVIVPKTSPAFSALGLLLADRIVDEMRSYITPAAAADLARVEALFADMAGRAREVLGGGRQKVEFRCFAQLCYPGQTFDLTVPMGNGLRPLTPKRWAQTIERFHDLHEELHTYAVREEQPILRGVRLTVVQHTAKPALPVLAATRVPAQPVSRRRAYFGGRFVAVPVFAGPSLRAGQKIAGPAIIEEPFTTIVLHPGDRATIDRLGNYRIEIGT
ncbi:MAG: hydantoinase/oxoprolinase family protein [Candidatus Binatia bacterium]|nr:hydantoinase/oxoprolinase family protein [Candidatus Binatia bacterium]